MEVPIIDLSSDSETESSKKPVQNGPKSGPILAPKAEPEPKRVKPCPASKRAKLQPALEPKRAISQPVPAPQRAATQPVPVAKRVTTQPTPEPKRAILQPVPALQPATTQSIPVPKRATTQPAPEPKRAKPDTPPPESGSRMNEHQEGDDGNKSQEELNQEALENLMQFHKDIKKGNGDGKQVSDINSKIKKTYTKCVQSYKKSPHLYSLIDQTHKSVVANPQNMYSCLHNLVQEMKTKHAKKEKTEAERKSVQEARYSRAPISMGPGPSGVSSSAQASPSREDSPSPDSVARERKRRKEEKERRRGERRKEQKRQEHLDSLKRAERKITKKIRQLEAEPVSWSDEENSAYLQEDCYKKRLIKIHKKIKELENERTGLDKGPRISFTESAYPELNREIEKFMSRSRKQKFPDFIDVRRVVSKANRELKLRLPDFDIRAIAEKAFRCVGRQLQSHRCRELAENLGSLLAVEEGEDPAEQDPELEAKLQANFEAYQHREEEVLLRFSRLAEEGGLQAEEGQVTDEDRASNEDDNSEDSEQEDSDDEDKVGGQSEEEDITLHYSDSEGKEEEERKRKEGGGKKSPAEEKEGKKRTAKEGEGRERTDKEGEGRKRTAKESGGEEGGESDKEHTPTKKAFVAVDPSAGKDFKTRGRFLGEVSPPTLNSQSEGETSRHALDESTSSEPEYPPHQLPPVRVDLSRKKLTHRSAPPCAKSTNQSVAGFKSITDAGNVTGGVKPTKTDIKLTNENKAGTSSTNQSLPSAIPTNQSAPGFKSTNQFNIRQLLVKIPTIEAVDVASYSAKHQVAKKSCSNLNKPAPESSKPEISNLPEDLSKKKPPKLELVEVEPSPPLSKTPQFEGESPRSRSYFDEFALHVNRSLSQRDAPSIDEELQDLLEEENQLRQEVESDSSTSEPPESNPSQALNAAVQTEISFSKFPPKKSTNLLPKGDTTNLPPKQEEKQTPPKMQDFSHDTQNLAPKILNLESASSFSSSGLSTSLLTSRKVHQTARKSFSRPSVQPNPNPRVELNPVQHISPPKPPVQRSSPLKPMQTPEITSSSQDHSSDDDVIVLD